MNHSRMVWIAVACTAMLLGPGCSQFDLRRRIPWLDEEKNEVVAPEKVVAIWTDTVLYQPDQPAQRGFGGRMMFYKGGDSKSVKVEGTLIVYAFDEEGRDKLDFQSRADLPQGPTAPPEKRKKGAKMGSSLNSRPDRKYVFTPEQFAKHYSKSNLGHSYSIWIPWDEAGGPQRELSLIVRFIPEKEGTAIIGEQTTHILPGTQDDEAEPQAVPAGTLPVGAATPAAGVPAVGHPGTAMMGRNWDPAVQQTAYQTAVPANGAPGIESEDEKAKTRMQTTTIGVPMNSNLRAGSSPVTSRLDQARASSRRTPPVPVVSESAAAQGLSTQATQAPGVRYGPLQYQAPAEPPARLKYDRAPWRPHPTEWRSVPESAPQAESGS